MEIVESDRQKQRNFFKAQFQNRMRKPQKFEPMKSSQARERAMYRLLMESFRDKSKVIWKSTFVPSEIIYAVGAIPLYIESFSAIAASLDICTPMLKESEKHGFSKDSCTFLRGIMGASLKDMLPEPDALVSTSYYCDGDPKIFDIFAEKYEKPHFYLHVPSNVNEDWAVDILAEQLEEITLELAKATGTEFRLERLSEIINNSNEAFKYCKKAMDLRKQSPSLIRGFEAFDYIAAISQLWGSTELIKIYRLLYEELEDRATNNKPALVDEQFRLLWCHLRPYYNDDLFDYLEINHKAVIAFENVNLLTWGIMDPEKPFKALATKLLTSAGIGPADRMTGWVSKMVEDYKIDGVMWMASWGCRHFNSLAQIVKDGLRKEKDVPFFILDLECVDKTNYSKEQVRTRLDAFMEVLADNAC